MMGIECNDIKGMGDEDEFEFEHTHLFVNDLKDKI
tara:strand:- start:564 stop:668 length:105 start_codon:yes stop_codon:yes gene_type:complete